MVGQYGVDRSAPPGAPPPSRQGVGLFHSQEAVQEASLAVGIRRRFTLVEQRMESVTPFGVTPGIDEQARRLRSREAGGVNPNRVEFPILGAALFAASLSSALLGQGA